MVRIRTENSILVYDLTGERETQLRLAVSEGIIPTRRATLVEDSEFRDVFIVTEGRLFTIIEDVKLYFYEGTIILMT